MLFWNTLNFVTANNEGALYGPKYAIFSRIWYQNLPKMANKQGKDCKSRILAHIPRQRISLIEDKKSGNYEGHLLLYIF